MEMEDTSTNNGFAAEEKANRCPCDKPAAQRPSFAARSRRLLQQPMRQCAPMRALLHGLSIRAAQAKELGRQLDELSARHESDGTRARVRASEPSTRRR
jgi:hypothetical protein